VKQHIDSFNYFIKHEIKEIMDANRLIRLPKYSTYYLEYVGCAALFLPPKIYEDVGGSAFSQ
jgi:hypothetical protein